MTYKGKVDWWIGLAIVAGICFPAISAFRAHDYWLLAPPGCLTFFMLACCYPQTFETAGDGLYIRAGLTKRVIPWGTITIVSPSADSRSSLAMSLDRVLIENAGGSVVIAPENQVQFFDDIASHCPQLSQRGMDLVIALN